MSLEIESNRVMNSIRQSESDNELNSIRKWIDLIEVHYKNRLEADKLRVELEKKRNLMPKLSVTIKDISTIENLLDFVRYNLTDSQESMLVKDGEKLLEKIYRSVEPV